MTIPGRGDLAPPHRQAPIWRYLTIVLVLALLGGGGYAAYQGLTGSSTAKPGALLPLCAKSSTKKAPPIPQSKVTVYNASLITGLAAHVAGELRHRGFPVGRVGNAAKVGKGIATIRYSADRKVEATKLASQVKGATMVPASGQHLVELDINPKFTALASKREGAAAFKAAVAAQHLITPTPTPTPTCRARS